MAVDRLKLAVAQSQWWQWIIAAVVGLILALYLLFTISWKPRYAPFLALAALFPFAALVVGDIKRILLAVILIETPLHVDINLFTDWQAISVNAIGGLNISITTICLAILYVLWSVELMVKKTANKQVVRASFPIIGYLAAVILSVVVAQNVILAAYEVFLLFQTLLLVLYIIANVRNRQDVQFVVMLFLIGLVLESMLLIGVRILGHNVNLGGIKIGIDASGRAVGTFGSPNVAAGYLELLLAPAMAVLLTPLPRKYKWLGGLAFTLGSVAMLLTFSRGGWVALAVSISLFCLIAFVQGWLAPKLPLTILAILIPLLLIFWEPIEMRLLGDDFGAAESRIVMARQAFRVIEVNPILGVGANNYAVWYEQHPAPEIDPPRFRTVHNKYLLVWAETGIIGLMAFLGFLFSIVLRGWRVGRTGDNLLSPLALGFAMAVVGQMAHMFFDIFHSRPPVQTLWIVAAIVIAIFMMKIGPSKIRSVGT